jgi:enoyl-CoA hydratase/carnithine racemase
MATHGVTGIGKKKVLELAMTGDLLSATEAEEIGLVNYAVSADQAQDVARELARSTTASAPGSIASITDIWQSMEDDLIASWFTNAIDELTERIQTQEGRHGLSAFLDDEPPRWER